MQDYKNILICAPHPDDEIIGCGGLIINLIDRGYNVSIMYLSSGDSIQEIREKEAKNVCNNLGVKSPIFLKLFGSNFSVSATNINKVINAFNKVKPDIIYINHDQDSDYEHKISYNLIAESFWRYNEQHSDHNLKGLILYEVHKPLHTYNLVENISDVIEKKMQLMSLYKSQMMKSRLDLGIKGLNQYRGTFHENCDYAEVFQIKRLSELFPNDKSSLS